MGQGFRAGMRGGGVRPRLPTAGVGIRQKTRGERGGKNALTAGKLAKLRELALAGVAVPKNLQGKVKLLSSYGFVPTGPKLKGDGSLNTINSNDPNSSGGALSGPSLLAAGRAAAAAHVAVTSGREYNDSDPFAPSAAEKRLMAQQSFQKCKEA